MRNKFVLCVVLIFIAQAKAETINRDKFGLGLMLGSLDSITGKYWLSNRGALDFGLGFGGYPGTAIYGDYLWHIPAIYGTGTKFGRETNGYVGGGLGVGFWSGNYVCGRWNCGVAPGGTGVFLRAFFGSEWSPGGTRFGIFAELGPTFLMLPYTFSELDFDIGGRYYF